MDATLIFTGLRQPKRGTLRITRTTQYDVTGDGPIVRSVVDEEHYNENLEDLRALAVVGGKAVYISKNGKFQGPVKRTSKPFGTVRYYRTFNSQRWRALGSTLGDPLRHGTK